MKEILQLLSDRTGTFEGSGFNHEGQKFRGVLNFIPQIDGKGLAVEFSATGEDGAVFHREHSLLGLTPAETLSLWVLSSNHPGVVEHAYFEDRLAQGAERTFSFRAGNLADPGSFREVVSIDLWKNGDVSYRYAWGLPGGEFKERSGVRMVSGRNRPIPEAKLKSTGNGWVPEGEGWYVINAKEAQWRSNEKFGDSCGFEGSHRFGQYGINVHVIHPGQPNCHYHGEDDQEDFLVIRGECRLLIEGQERQLKAWDFVHCPKWARHVFVGSGDQPCVIVMVGGRTGRGVIYPVTELARKYGACPDQETDSPKLSYARAPRSMDCGSRLPE